MILLTPGPTFVPEHIRVAMSAPTLHHRTKEFEVIFEETRELLKRLFNMPETLMFAATGSGAMEGCMLNLCHKKALTINAGKFGERFTKIAKAYNIPHTELSYEWGKSAEAAQVVQAIKDDSEIDALFIQICESSAGTRHPVEEIAAQIKAARPEVMIVADGITAVGVEPIDTSNIDALITGSQKALMLPPGLSMVGLSSAAVAKCEAKPGGYYFNFAIELKNQRKNTTAWTAATTLIIGLNAVLKEFFTKGADAVYANVRRLSTSSRAALKALGLEEFPDSPALSMSTFSFDGANGLRKIMQNEFGVNVAGGQDALNDKIFRINHMGFVEVYHAAWAVQSVEMALSRLGKRGFDGTASKIFSESFYGL